MEFPDQLVRLWLRSQMHELPRQVSKHICRGEPQWVVLIPPSIACGEVESLFVRFVNKQVYVERALLEDGSVILSCQGVKTP
jgi:hypothetical protein